MTDSKGTLIWVAADATASRELIESTAHEFKMTVRHCTPPEALEVVRVSFCDVLGIEIDPAPRENLIILKELHERLPRLTILAASSDTSMTVIRAALERGAADVLSLPLSRQEVSKAFIKITQLAARQAAASTGEVITVVGARGGLGVTTLAVNLASRLRALAGGEVGLADLDLQRGDVAAFLNLTPTQSLGAIAGARGDVDDIFLHGTLTRHPSGIFVLAAPAQIEEADTISHEDVQLALRLMRAQFRYTVVDTPRTITGPVLAALEDSERILVLSDLSVPGVRAARRLFELFNRLGTPPERVKLVVTHAVAGPVDVKEAVRTIGKEPFAVIPADPQAASGAMNTGVPLNGTRHSGLSLAVSELANKLTGTAAPTKGARAPLLRRIFQLQGD